MAIPINLPQRNYIQGLWNFEDNFNDSSNNGNNLTETSGTVAFATGKIGKAADIEAGDSEYLTITDAAQSGLDITGEITIAAWVKVESIGTYRTLISKINTPSNNSYGLRFTDANKVQFLLTADGSTWVTATSSTAITSTSTFYHITATLNQTTDLMQTYINGSADGSAVSHTGNIYNGAANFAIGCSFGGGSPENYFDGLIDEVIIWNTALTPTEVAAVYNISAYKYTKGGTAIGSPMIF